MRGVKVIHMRSKAPNDADPKYIINTTSGSKNWSSGLSPFFVGPVNLYGTYVAKNVENAWQFAKVYESYARDGEPKPEYYVWAQNGWNDQKAHRFPMGRGARPLYSYWNGEKLSYIDARKRIYCPLYEDAVKHTSAFAQLRELYESAAAEGKCIYLRDWDGYNTDEDYETIINNPNKKMGHAFVLAMMLENKRAY